jgi:hypothetical protein
MKPTLKTPGTNPLTLKYDGPLSDFAFHLHLRRHTKGNFSNLWVTNQAGRGRLIHEVHVESAWMSSLDTRT